VDEETEVAEEIDCVSKTEEVKAVLTLAVVLEMISSSASVISLPVEFAREMRPGSFFKPKSSLADRAKSFSTLGVRKIRRFLLLSDALPGDKGVDRAAWVGEVDLTGVFGEGERLGDEETARDKVRVDGVDEDLVNDVEGCGATRALYGAIGNALVSERIVSRESS